MSGTQMGLALPTTTSSNASPHSLLWICQIRHGKGRSVNQLATPLHSCTSFAGLLHPTAWEVISRCCHGIRCPPCCEVSCQRLLRVICLEVYCGIPYLIFVP